jgi:mannan endo-1,4-beta-mannosidase
MMARVMFSVLAIAGAISAQTSVYQAEQAKLSGVSVGTSVAGYSGNESTRKQKVEI